MADANLVILIGNLTKAPEIRYTPSGKTVGTILLAVNRTFKTQGESREETCYVDCEVWGNVAENCAKHLDKGSPVYIEGRLKLDTWEKDGQKHSKLRGVGQRVQFLGRPRNTERRDEDPAAAHEGESYPGPEPGAHNDYEESECPF